MAKTSIGTIDCPACGNPAEVRETKHGRAYALCQDTECGFQGFTRSAGADQKMRSRMKPHAAAPAPQEAPPANEPEAKPKKKDIFDALFS